MNDKAYHFVITMYINCVRERPSVQIRLHFGRCFLQKNRKLLKYAIIFCGKIHHVSSALIFFSKIA